MVAAAEGPNAMWYRFGYSAEYLGDTVSGDRMVYCAPVATGESLIGAVGSAATFLQIPQLVDERLPDGSRLLVRIPDMCRYNRVFIDAEGRTNRSGKMPLNPQSDGIGRQPGWKDFGPYHVLPPIVWVAPGETPDRMEAYLGTAAYEDARARLRAPAGVVRFLAPGEAPADANAIIAGYYEALSADPPLEAGQSRSDSVLPGDLLAHSWLGIAVVPVDHYPGENGNASLRYSNEDFAIYSTPPDSNFTSLTTQHVVHGSDLGGCLYGFTHGRPGITDLPFDDADFGSDLVSMAQLDPPSVSEENRVRLAGAAEKKRRCYERLGEIRSLAVRDGDLRLADLPRGVLVFHRVPSDPGRGRPRGIADVVARLGGEVPERILAAGPVDQTLPLQIEMEGTAYRFPLQYGSHTITDRRSAKSIYVLSNSRPI